MSSEGLNHLEWNSDDDETSLIDGIVADSYQPGASYAKTIEHSTGQVQTALEMVGRTVSREQARELAVTALTKMFNLEQ